jgi:ParB/RepB/Spo0J family partition protein
MTINDAPESVLELRQVNPAMLVIRDQAREDATPDEQLVDSVRRHGLIQPPVVKEDPETGELVIVTGHRRVGAAILADLERIIVIIRPFGGAEITLEEQIVENERRKQLTPNDLTRGYEQLTLFGLRPEDIAAGLGEKVDRVRAGLRVVKSQKARDLIANEPTIDLERAAIIAEFDEHPKLQAKLIETATTRPENFSRDVESARSQREVDARVAKLKTTLADDNVTVVEVSNWSDNYWRGKDGRGRALDKLDIRRRRTRPRHLEGPKQRRGDPRPPRVPPDPCTPHRTCHRDRPRRREPRQRRRTPLLACTRRPRLHPHRHRQRAPGPDRRSARRVEGRARQRGRRGCRRAGGR